MEIFWRRKQKPSLTGFWKLLEEKKTNEVVHFTNRGKKSLLNQELTMTTSPGYIWEPLQRRELGVFWNWWYPSRIFKLSSRRRKKTRVLFGCDREKFSKKKWQRVLQILSGGNLLARHKSSGEFFKGPPKSLIGWSFEREKSDTWNLWQDLCEFKRVTILNRDESFNGNSSL